MLPDKKPYAEEGFQRPFVVSAPGKVILFGEHSVVYGKRSLAFSLGLRTELTISPACDSVQLHLPEINIEKSWHMSSLESLWKKFKKDRKLSIEEPLPISAENEKVLRSFLGICDKKELQKGELGLIAFFHLYTSIFYRPVSFTIKVKSQMPVGAGLGSSAAYAVCLAGALIRISGHLDLNTAKIKVSEKSLDIICKWAFCCEQILHGSPSGIDNAICTYGGCVSFKEGKIDNIIPPNLTIMLVNTRVSRNTKILVSNVKEKLSRQRIILEAIFDSMDKVAESALKTINEMKTNSISSEILRKKFDDLNELIDINQCLLSALNVSHPSLDELVAIAKCHGFHAKLTGAGGGGFGIILLPPSTPENNIASCKEILESKGFEAWHTNLGGHGILFEYS